MSAIETLTEEQIADLLGSVRERGAYKRVFNDFLESAERGWNVSAHFNGKKPATIYQGFNNVKKDSDSNGKYDHVRVINHEDTVYLILTDAAE